MKYPPDLCHAAEVAVKQSLRVHSGERVLIATNPDEDVSIISFAIHDAVVEAGASPVIVYQQPKTQFDFCEEEIIGALQTVPDVFISLSAERLGKDRKAIQNPYVVGKRSYDSCLHYLLYGEKKIRGFWSPRVTVDSFVRAVPVDYPRMRIECQRVKEVLDAAVSVRVTNGNGTDIVFGTEGRNAFVDDGDFSFPGMGGNLPAGETFISPVMGTAQGVIVFDGSISSHLGEILIEKPITVKVRGGFVTELSGGGEAERLLETIRMGEENARTFEEMGRLPREMGKVYAKNARNIGELGIGLNPQAKIIGNMLEDEKVYRTCHFAVGSNYDEDAPALIHLDGLVSEPTIIATLPGDRQVTILLKGDLAVGK